MPERSQRVVLVRHTLDPEALTALGARLCYAGGDVDRLLKTIEEKDQRAFVERVMAMGHESVLEHASFTFLVEGVSRVLLAQLTRHRIASFSVQSQRYVSYAGGFGYIVPPAIRALGSDAEAEYHAQMAQMQAWYEGWQKRLGDAGEKSNEDARFVLPGAHVQPRPVGDPRAGRRDVRPVLPGGARPVQGRGARMPARRVPRGGKVLRKAGADP